MSRGRQAVPRTGMADVHTRMPGLDHDRQGFIRAPDDVSRRQLTCLPLQQPSSPLLFGFR